MNYRKICQEYYNYSNEQMLGMDVHHIDGNHANNDPKNLQLLSPEEHSVIHNDDFILWAREGSKLGNVARIKRQKEQGLTQKELEYRKIRIEKCKNGLHRTPHLEETKQIISEKKKKYFIDRTKHPMWGRTTYKVTSPEKETFIVSDGWTIWCRERNLQPSNLILVAQGKRKQHKGWKCKYA